MKTASKTIGKPVAAILLAGMIGAVASPALSDQVIANNLIVIGSECVGFDCVNGESFGFDTLRLKENNTRIKFDDTSSTASFPNVDWLLFANDSANGGMNRFGIQDATNNRNIFSLQANAPDNALFVESTGDVGFGTSTPVVDLHTVDGDTPTLRLDQNGSLGWSPHVWDVAGNETNFFIRDVSSGSLLPLRIRPGAPSNTLYLDGDGDVGIGTSSPDHKLDINGNIAMTASRSTLFIRGDNDTTHVGGLQMAALDNGATAVITPTNAAGGTVDGEVRFGGSGAFNNNLVNVRISGVLITGGPTCGSGCDRVFDPGFDLPTIGEHAEAMHARRHLPEVGPTQPGMSINVAEKIGGLLNELEKAHLYIQQLNERLEALEAKLEDRG